MLPAEFMSDALDDLRDDYLAREGFALDAEIAALCDECPTPIAPRDAAAKVAYAMELLASGAITTFYAIGWSPMHLLVWMPFVTGNQAADIVQRCAAAKHKVVTLDWLDGILREHHTPDNASAPVRHRLYSDAIRKAPRRMTAAERNAAEVAAMYGPRRPLKCEVAR